ncbi:uncharacterized protein BJ171DRAFT_500126 [Polychytrium aggregatum]|uniref:uncharacterized protein n=1 Tax=Polychytrium aggregatum TaxID=110093 RepID=UPI0022FF450A|nr:uncharacterized protein BJ171DRAFT_500126 [Polychytrium aggregatum]KAI9205926.1 hypothetical protein BJ171DRAFT_500126 [Polychytrium aggregatum]
MSRITLTEGVVGGFVAPTPRRLVIIDLDESGGVQIQHHIKTGGSGPNAEYKVLQSPPEISVLEVTSLTNSIVQNFRALPREEPVGGEDIYHLDTQIAIETPDFSWCNVANQGCNIVPSSVKPTDSQKQQFKAAAASLISLAEKYATVTADI